MVSAATPAPAGGSVSGAAAKNVSPAREDVTERWYVVEIAGQRAGWMRAATVRERPPEGPEGGGGDDGAKGSVRTESELEFSLRRADDAVTMRTSSVFVETGDGRPVRMRQVQAFGSEPVTQEYDFGPEGVRAVSEQGGRRTERMLPTPAGEFLTPAAAEEYVRSRLRAGAEEIVVRTIDPSSGPEPVTVTRRVGERTSLRVGERELAVTRCVVTVSSFPGIESAEFIDDAGVLVRSETSAGGLKMVMRAGTREEARGDAGGAAGAGPELMVSLFVRPDRVIPSPRGVRRGVYVIESSAGALPELPETGVQSVRLLDRHAARVVVDMDAPAGLGVGAGAGVGAAERAALLASTTAINTEDEQVRALARRALAGKGAGDGKGDAPARAEALRRAVFRHVRDKSLGVGFGTASETVRSRRGDCTEHALLLAAALRAEGIPARVATGLVYADQFAGERDVFGYHMWTQALVEVDGEERWVDLDATLSEAGAFDATHIALAVSALDGENWQASLAGVTPLLGAISVRVEEAK